MLQPATRAKDTPKRQYRLLSAAAEAAVTVVATSANQPVAAAPRQQTGNEHLDGKLKVIGESHLLISCKTLPKGALEAKHGHKVM